MAEIYFYPEENKLRGHKLILKLLTWREKGWWHHTFNTKLPTKQQYRHTHTYIMTGKGVDCMYVMIKLLPKHSGYQKSPHWFIIVVDVGVRGMKRQLPFSFVIYTFSTYMPHAYHTYLGSETIRRWNKALHFYLVSVWLTVYVSSAHQTIRATHWSLVPMVTNCSCLMTCHISPNMHRWSGYTTCITGTCVR